jgi:hypothetical protein
MCAIFCLIIFGNVDESRRIIYINTCNIIYENIFFGSNIPFIESYNSYLSNSFIEQKIKNVDGAYTEPVGFLTNPVNDILHILHDGGLIWFSLFVFICIIFCIKTTYDDHKLIAYFLMLGLFNFSFYNNGILTSIFCISFCSSVSKTNNEYT